MAVGESAGSVYVTIDGDASPLMGKFAQAAGAARAAGETVASGFNTAANASDLTSASIADLITVIREEGAAASLAAQRNVAMAGSFRQVGQAAHGSVTEIQAVGGAIRTGLGEQSIRAVERFLTMIPGIGAAAQVAFPIIGAVALFDAISRVVGKSEELKKSLEDQAKAAKDADDAETHLVATLDSLSVKSIGRDIGPAAQARATVTQLKMEAQDAQGEIGKLESQLRAVRAQRPTPSQRVTEPFTGGFSDEQAAKAQTIEEQISKQLDIVQEKYAEAGDAALEAGKKASEQGGALTAQRLKNDEDAATRFGELSKSRAEAAIEAARQGARASDDALRSQQARMISEADAEVAKAKSSQEAIQGYALATRDRQIGYIQNVASAESAGKSQSEQQSIGLKAAGEIQKAKDDYAATIEKAQESTSTAVEAQAAAYVTAARQETEAQRQFNLELEHTATLHARWADLKSVSDKTDEDRFKESQRGGLSTDPRLQGTAMGAALEVSQRGGGQTVGIQESHIAQLQKQLAAEQQINQPLSEQLTLKQQILQAQIALATAQGQTDQADKLAAANVALQQTLVQWRALDLGNAAQQIGQAIVQLPATLANALAKGIFDHGKGQSIGKDVGQGLKQTGEQLTGRLLQAGLEKLFAEIALQTGLQAALNALFPTVQTAQTVAITAAIAASTGAIVTAIAAGAALDVFAGGTDSAPGGYAVVGERGPEIMHVPKGAQIIPNHKIGKYADGTPNFSRATSRSSSMSIGELHVHAHGVSNPDAFARQAVAAIPHELKRQSSTFSPYSS